jgi:hypothetical protein
MMCRVHWLLVREREFEISAEQAGCLEAEAATMIQPGTPREVIHAKVKIYRDARKESRRISR